MFLACTEITLFYINFSCQCVNLNICALFNACVDDVSFYNMLSVIMFCVGEIAQFLVPLVKQSDPKLNVEFAPSPCCCFSSAKEILFSCRNNNLYFPVAYLCSPPKIGLLQILYCIVLGCIPFRFCKELPIIRKYRLFVHEFCRL